MDELGATAEIEEAAPVVEEQKSMDDTIRETLHALQDKGIETDKEVADAPATPEEKAQRIRDEKGKFAAKAETPDAAEVAPVDDIPVKAAPNTWRKEVAEKWSTLPPEVQAEVERREADFHRGIEQYKQAANFAQSMERAITPYAATLQKLNVTADKAVSELMGADHRLRSGDIAYFSQLADSYGFNRSQLAEIFSGQQPTQQYIDPNLSAVNQRVQQLEGYIQNQTMMGQQREQETLNSEISSFAADPSHSHFESVKGHMAALIQAGQAQDLASAYEQAVWANPTTRAAMLASQQAAARAEATQKAQAAKAAASVNVRARPSMPVSQPIGSMDDTIRATLRKLQNA